MNTAIMASVSSRVVFGEPQLLADGDLLALAFASNDVLCSVEEPGVLRRWDAHAGQQLDWQCLSELETVWAFSRDARMLASGSDELTLWDGISGEVLTAAPQKSWITAVTLSADGRLVATGHDDGTVRSWSATDNCLSLVQEWNLHQNGISAVAFSHDGRLLSAAGEDKIVSVVEVDSGILLGICVGHTDRIPALAWRPDHKVLVSVGWDATARVWNAPTQEPLLLLNDHAAQVTAAAFSPDGDLLACADSSSSVHVWDFVTRRKLRVLTGPPGEISCLAFSPDGTRLAASGDIAMHVWDVATGQVLAGAGPRTLTRASLAVSADGERLVTNTGGTAPRVWQVSSRQSQPLAPTASPVHGLAVTPDGQWIAGAAETCVRLWNAQTGAVVHDCDGPDEIITTVACAPNGQFLASGSSLGTAVWVWRVEDHKPVLIIPDPLHNCTVESLAFHPNSRFLAIGGIDWLSTGGSSGGVSIWDLHERCEIAVFPGGATCVAFHPDGRRLAFTTTEQSIGLWELRTQELQAELTGHDGAVACLAFSPDGKWLISGGEDRTLRVWKDDGAEHSLHELDSQITSLAFSADGRFLFVAHANTTCSQFLVADLVK